MTNWHHDETLEQALQRGATFRCRLTGNGIRRTLSASLRDGNAELAWSVALAPGAPLADAAMLLFESALHNLSRASDAPSVAEGRVARPLPRSREVDRTSEE